MNERDFGIDQVTVIPFDHVGTLVEPIEFKETLLNTIFWMGSQERADVHDSVLRPKTLHYTIKCRDEQKALIMKALSM